MSNPSAARTRRKSRRSSTSDSKTASTTGSSFHSTSTSECPYQDGCRPPSIPDNNNDTNINDNKNRHNSISWQIAGDQNSSISERSNGTHYRSTPPHHHHHHQNKNRIVRSTVTSAINSIPPPPNYPPPPANYFTRIAPATSQLHYLNHTQPHVYHNTINVGNSLRVPPPPPPPPPPPCNDSAVAHNSPRERFRSQVTGVAIEALHAHSSHIPSPRQHAYQSHHYPSALPNGRPESLHQMSDYISTEFEYNSQPLHHRHPLPPDNRNHLTSSDGAEVYAFPDSQLRDLPYSWSNAESTHPASFTMSNVRNGPTRPTEPLNTNESSQLQSSYSSYPTPSRISHPPVVDATHNGASSDVSYSPIGSPMTCEWSGYANDHDVSSPRWTPEMTIEEWDPNHHYRHPSPHPRDPYRQRGFSDATNSLQTSPLSRDESTSPPQQRDHISFQSTPWPPPMAMNPQISLTGDFASPPSNAELLRDQSFATQQPHFLVSCGSSVSATPICPSTVPYPPTESLESLWDFTGVTSPTTEEARHRNMNAASTTPLGRPPLHPPTGLHRFLPQTSPPQQDGSTYHKSLSLTNPQPSPALSVSLGLLSRQNHPRHSNLSNACQTARQVPFSRYGTARRNSEPIDPESIPLNNRDEALPALDPSVFLRPTPPQSAPARSLAGDVWGEGFMVPTFKNGRPRDTFGTQRQTNQFEFLFDLQDDLTPAEQREMLCGTDPSQLANRNDNEESHHHTTPSRMGLDRVALALLGFASTLKEQPTSAPGTQEDGAGEEVDGERCGAKSSSTSKHSTTFREAATAAVASVLGLTTLRSSTIGKSVREVLNGSHEQQIDDEDADCTGLKDYVGDSNNTAAGMETDLHSIVKTGEAMTRLEKETIADGGREVPSHYQMTAQSPGTSNDVSKSAEIQQADKSDSQPQHEHAQSPFAALRFSDRSVWDTLVGTLGLSFREGMTRPPGSNSSFPSETKQNRDAEPVVPPSSACLNSNATLDQTNLH